MSVCSRIFRRYSLRDIAAGRQDSSGVVGWLSSFDGYPSSDGKVLKIEAIDYDQYISHVGFDYNRFAYSSIESMYEFNNSSFGESSNGWSAIRQYYSAFFSIHAILRSVGMSILYIDNEDIRKINEYIEIFGINHKIEKGTYIVSYRFLDGDHKIFIEKYNGKMASHEHSWNYFGTWINSFAEQITLRKDVDSREFIGIVQDISNVLKHSSSNYNWLSTFRNKVNYRHSYEMWKFDKNKTAKADTFKHCVKYKTSDEIIFANDGNKFPKKQFQTACLLLSAVNLEMVCDLKTKVKANSIFAYNFQKIVLDQKIL